MIVIYEPVCHGNEHELFNAGIIAAAAEQSGGKAVFVGDSTHIQKLQQYCPTELANAVDWRPIEIPPRRMQGFCRRLPLEMAAFKKVFAIATDASAKALVCTGITEPGLAALKFILQTTRGNYPVGVFFHSILEKFTYSAKRRYLLSSFTSKRLKYIFLSRAIHHEMLRLVPAIRNYSDWIPHPAAISPSLSAASAQSAPPYGFAFLGRTSIGKGFPLFLKLARDLRNTPAIFEIIGRIDESELRETQAVIREGAHLAIPDHATAAMPTALYHSRLGASAYAVMPYAWTAYRLTYSGAALDAITAGKPIIALRGPLFNELFDDLGDIGYLCDDYAELCETVRQLATDPPLEHYAAQRQNVVRALVRFETPAISKRLGAALWGEP